MISRHCTNTSLWNCPRRVSSLRAVITTYHSAPIWCLRWPLPHTYVFSSHCGWDSWLDAGIDIDYIVRPAFCTAMWATVRSWSC